MLTIVTAMLLFVIPMFQGIYKQLGGTLPAPTQFLINISNICRKFWYVIFVGRGRRRDRVPAVDQLRRGPQAVGRDQAEGPDLRQARAQDGARPVLAARCRRWCARVSRSSSRSTSSPTPPATTSSPRRCATRKPAVKRGDPLSKKLEDHPVFPPMVVQMMAVGEETGALDEMLDKIADFYDQEVEATVDALTSLIEPTLDRRDGCVRRRHDHLALPADVQHHQAHQVAAGVGRPRAPVEPVRHRSPCAYGPVFKHRGGDCRSPSSAESRGGRVTPGATKGDMPSAGFFTLLRLVVGTRSKASPSLS